MKQKVNPSQTYNSTKRSIRDYIQLVMKGMAMGAADVVPGVSGGTIAFIVGIYEELIDSIKGINFECIKLLLKGRFFEFWKVVNGNFLLSIVLGIGISVFSLAKIITYLLSNYPILVWSFFFGLVLASTIFVAQSIKKWKPRNIASFIIGTLGALYITMATPAETPEHALFIFFSGAIAICAMILPGISGSFILVLLGKYFYIMEAIKSFSISTILTFIAGAGVGIISFSHILSYALKRFHNTTIALLSGFMLGSLNKIWPWKETIETYTDRHGEIKPLVEANIMPNEAIAPAVALMCAGFLLVYALERFSAKPDKG